MAFNYDAIFMTGPQGSGKGTQDKRLAAKLDFFLWDTGAILRQILTEKTPLAEKVSIINSGKFLSDELLIEVLKDRLAAVPQSKGIIFDGVPRRMGQAEFLLGWLREHGRA